VKTASAAKIAAQFADYLEASRDQPVLITLKGKPVAVLLAVQDKADAEQLAVRSRSLRSIFEEAHEQLERGDGIPQDRFWQKVADARQRNKRAHVKEDSDKTSR
jgi:prevent-host-death family protein